MNGCRTELACLLRWTACLLLLCGCQKDDAPVTPATAGRSADKAETTVSENPAAAVKTLMRRGRVAAAADQVQAALLRNPQDPDLLLIAGDVAVAQGDAARAAELYESAISAFGGSHAESMLKLGQEYMNLGRPFDSIRVMEEAVSAYPQVADYRLKLVGLQLAVGLEFESQEHLRWLVQRGHGGVNLLIVLSDLSRPQTVESTCRYALKNYPKDLRPNYSLARLPAYHSNWNKVADLLAPVVERHPDFAPAQALYGRALLELQNDSRLSQWYRSLPSGIEGQPQYWLTMGGIAEQSGDIPMAARAYWNAVSLDENSGEALLKRSASMSQLKEAENARSLADRAARITVLRDGVDSFLSWKSNSQSDAVVIARSLNQLGRRWEATSWLRAAYLMNQNPQQDLDGIYKSVRSTLTAQTPWQIPEFAVAKKIDVEKYPKPVWSDSGSAAPTVADPATESEIRFVNQAAERQLLHTCRLNKSVSEKGGLTIYQSGAGGAGVIDFDLDGWPDLLLTSVDGNPMRNDSSPNHLFRNHGGKFSDVTGVSDSGGTGFAQGIAVGDYNADGFPDLFVANIGRNQLLRNNGDGTFRDVTQQAGLTDEVWTSSAGIADLDGDGLADLFQLGYCQTEKALQQLCVDADLKEPRSCAPLAFSAQRDRVWQNAANGGYVDRTATWLSRHEAGRGLGLVIGSLDRRPGIDVYVANDMTANHYWSSNDGEIGSEDTDDQNAGTGQLDQPFRLSEQASIRGLAVNGRSLSQASMGIAAGDVDQDGDVDFLLTHFSGDYNTFYEQVADGMWADRSKRVGIVEPSQQMLGYGTQWIDADNDGTLELVIANGDIDDFAHQDRLFRQPAQLFRRQSNGLWSQTQRQSLGDYFQRDHLGRAMVKLDFNRDQKQDLLITHLFEPVALLENETITNGSQCRFFFVGTTSGRDAIGTRITLKQSDRQLVGHLLAGDGFQCSNERCVKFGFGNEQGSGEILVDWPDGTREAFGRHELSGDYLIVQGSGEVYPHRSR